MPKVLENSEKALQKLSSLLKIPDTELEFVPLPGFPVREMRGDINKIVWHLNGYVEVVAESKIDHTADNGYQLVKGQPVRYRLYALTRYTQDSKTNDYAGFGYDRDVGLSMDSPDAPEHVAEIEARLVFDKTSDNAQEAKQ